MSQSPAPKYSAAEMADTGRWHLTVLVGPRRAEAWLKYIADTSAPQRLFATGYSEAELVESLECTLYDNPRALDDFSADILIDTPQALWVPASFTPGQRKALYGGLWPELAADIITDRSQAEHCLFALAAGLPQMLARTFPGARIASVLSWLRSNLPLPAQGLSVTLDLTGLERVNAVALDAKGLVSAVSLTSGDDAAAHVKELATLTGHTPAEVKVIVAAASSNPLAARVAAELVEAGYDAATDDIPQRLNAGGLPLAAALSATRRIQPQ